jgi:hypothetical protein
MNYYKNLSDTYAFIQSSGYYSLPGRPEKSLSYWQNPLVFMDSSSIFIRQDKKTTLNSKMGFHLKYQNKRKNIMKTYQLIIDSKILLTGKAYYYTYAP